MRRPALKTTLTFCIGILISYFTKIQLVWISFILLGSCIIYLIVGLTGERSKILNPVIFIIVEISGMFSYTLHTTLFPSNHIINYTNPEKKVAVVGKIIAEPDFRIEQTIIECEAETLITPEYTKAVTGKLRINVKSPNLKFKYGDQIEAYGRLWYPEFTRNPDAFDYRSYLKRKNIYGTMNIWESCNIRVIGKDKGMAIISNVALPIKRFIRNTIDTYLSDNQAGFLKGITIGQRGMLPKRVQECFQNTGAIHILAVSGLHVGIIATIVFLFLRVFRISLIIAQIITLLFLIIYAFMLDLRPPIVRATIMTIIGMIGLTTERDTDMLNVIACAALFILFINPQAIFEVSFQLSFISIISIIYLMPKIYPVLFGFIKPENHVARYFAGIFVASLAAQIGIMPLVAYYFYRVPIISIIANLIVIPLAGVCIALTFIMSIINLLPLKILTDIFTGVAWGATTFTLKTVELFNQIPYAYFWVHKPSVLFIGFFYLILLSGINSPVSKIARKVFVYSCIFGLNTLIWSRVYKINNPKIEVTYLDVGHGDCALIELPNNYNVLIDGGPHQKEFDTGEGIVAPFLRAKGISNLDIIVATNTKIYRIGGLRYIVENFKIKKFIGPNICYTSWAWLCLLKLVDYKDIQCKLIAGNVIANGSKAISKRDTILSHKDYIVETINSGDESNLGLRVNYKDVSLLFPGDVKEGEYQKSTILMIPKHGNKRYSSSKWISSIAPEIAVISCGRNPWAEPDYAVILRYKNLGAKVLRTDEEGAIIIRTDGRTIETETMKSLSEKEGLKHRVLRYTGLL
ncbi:MAG: DNA internalization-related competence protein ComEC/Rec2 [bacterium]|nr:DNA internalization-related competence protein ComEC/Rec2 [bacterium]